MTLTELKKIIAFARKSGAKILKIDGFEVEFDSKVVGVPLELEKNSVDDAVDNSGITQNNVLPSKQKIDMTEDDFLFWSTTEELPSERSMRERLDSKKTELS